MNTVERAPALVELALGTLLLWVALGVGQAALASPPAHTPIEPNASVPLGAEHDTDASLPTRAEEVANYKLAARLDETSHVVDGSGELVWTNRSRAPVKHLYFHLYLNAFKNEESLFLRSPFVTGRDEGQLSDSGYIEVSEMRARQFGQANLWNNAAKHSPGDPDDETDIRLPLPEAVEPGESLHLTFKFRSKLPRVVARTGHAGGFHMIAQWYPKIARLEDDGTFAHFAFHPQAEFYSDFGKYEVELDVAEHLKVGATGRLKSKSRQAGRQRYHYRAENVHDFAWCAGANLLEKGERIDDTDVRLLYPRGHTANAVTTLSALRRALPNMERRFGRYPHGVLTVVHPPDSAQAAGGMEYPTLITTGGKWWSAHSGARLLESLVTHELGHQWFQGLVATHEPKYPFLDEGLTSYAEQAVLDDLYGQASFARLGGWSLSGHALRRAAAARMAHDDPIAQPAAGFSSFASIGGLVYSRTATLLETLSRVYGRDRLERSMGRYARAYRYRHPTPEAWLDAIEQGLGADAREVARRALFERGFVDFLAETPESAAKAASTGRSSRVILRRHGSLQLPVDVELHFADGRRERKHWDGKAAWTAIDVVDPEPVVAVVVDPDHRVLLDQNLFNNARSVSPKLPWRSISRINYWSGLALSLVAP